MPIEGGHSKFLSYLTGARHVLSAVSVLIVAQPSSGVTEGFMNNLVFATQRFIFSKEWFPARRSLDTVVMQVLFKSR
jgi:hypothetical protein